MGYFRRQRPTVPPLWGSCRSVLGILFSRDFSDRGVEHAIESLLADRIRACDVLRMRHRSGTIYYINLLVDWADVATLRARRFSHWGELGYFTSILPHADTIQQASISRSN